METKVRTITPAIARQILEKSNEKGFTNRKINQNWYKYLSHCMKSGQWSLTGQGLSFDEHGNLIDGQHRLMAVIDSNTTQEFLIVTGVDSHTVLNYDTGKKRSPADTFDLFEIKNSRCVAALISSYIQIKSKRLSAMREDTKKRLFKTNEDILNEYMTTPELYQEIYKISASYRRVLPLLPSSQIGGIMTLLIKDNNWTIMEVKELFDEIHGITYETVKATGLLRKMLLKELTSKTKISHVYKMAIILKTIKYYITKQDIKQLSFDSTREAHPIKYFVNE